MKQSRDVSRHTVVSRLIVLGLSPKAACSFADQVLSWARSSGEEWTVSYLKGLKQQKFRLLAGLPLHPQLPKPKGAAKHVFSCSDRVSLDCLNIYTMFCNRGVSPTVKQLKKFLGSMSKAPCSRSDYHEAISTLNRMAAGYSRHLRSTFQKGSKDRVRFVDSFTTDHQLTSKLRSRGLETWGNTQARRAPFAMYGTKTRLESEMSTLDHMTLVTQPGLSMYPWDLACNEAYLRRSGLGMFPLQDFCRQDRDPWFEDDSWFGTISFIQEGGYKLRAVANPIRPIQCLLSSMGFGLYSVLNRIPNDFTHDQDLGVKYVQNHIDGKRNLYSVDLSDATNNLPLEPQLTLLAGLGAMQWEIDLFHHASRGLWSLPKCCDDKFARWTVGQPLGLFPSFASFALMHHLILETCFSIVMDKHNAKWRIKNHLRNKGVPRWKVQYRTCKTCSGYWTQTKDPMNRDYDRPWAIIGDDLVIFDDEVHHEYRLIIDALGVPVSEEKTLISSVGAEFAKRFIRKKSVILPYKWTPVGDAAVKSYLQRVGQRGLTTLTSKQRRVVLPFLSLPEPYGLGWNPMGLSWQERVPAEMEEWYRKGTTPMVAPRDFESPMTDVLKVDPQHFWYIGTGLDSAFAGSSFCAPSRYTGYLRLFDSMYRHGLPVLSNVAQVCYEHLVRRTPGTNQYQFDSDDSANLFRWYERTLATYSRENSDQGVNALWPGYKAIKDALKRKSVPKSGTD